MAHRPVILIDSATGSDTQASGAGPTTALFGTAASTDGTGLIVTLDGSPDLSGVATDGSAALWLGSAGSGLRRITAVDNTAKTVTVAVAYNTSQTELPWGIGGRRATLATVVPTELEAGWKVRIFTNETLTSTMTWSVAGDSTNGDVTIEGAPTVSPPPILTFTNNGNAFAITATGVTIQHLEFRNSNATKGTSNIAIACNVSGYIECRGLIINHATDKFYRGIARVGANPSLSIRNCAIGNTADAGIFLTGGSLGQTRIAACRIHNCGTHGIHDTSTANTFCLVRKCVFHNNTTNDILDARTANTSASAVLGPIIESCTFYASGGNAIKFTLANTALGSYNGLRVESNIFANGSAYAIEFPSGFTNEFLDRVGVQIASNNYYAMTSGFISVAGITQHTDTTTIDPAFTNAGSADFTLSTTTLKGKGFPTSANPIGKVGSNVNVSYPGAIQPDDSGGGGGSYNPFRPPFVYGAA